MIPCEKRSAPPFEVRDFDGFANLDAAQSGLIHIAGGLAGLQHYSIGEADGIVHSALISATVKPLYCSNSFDIA